MKKLLLIAAFILLPQLAFAGSQSYTSPGTYSFTVPAYGTLTVKVWGGGGGGGAGGAGGAGTAGGTGGNTTFGSVIAYGGTGGSQGTYCGGGTAAGSGGSASGGSINIHGNSGGAATCNATTLDPIGGNGGSAPYGGAGGAGGYAEYSAGATGGAGGAPGAGGGGGTYTFGEYAAGGGGSGGYSQITYSAGQLTPGQVITVYVGSGGAGGNPGESGYYGGNGAHGEVYISWTPAPSCTLSVSPNPVAYGSDATLTYSSSNAVDFYITYVGYVGSSGTASVGPLVTTTYTGSAGNGTATSTCATTLTVTSPANPSATIAASSSSIYTGQSDSITADFTAGSGDSLTADNIDGDSGNPSPWSGGLGATTDPDASKTITFSPTAAGTYTFYARATTSYFPSWATYSQTSVTVTQTPSCTPSTQYICTGSDGQTITASSTDSICQSTQNTIATCVSPKFCSDGSAICLDPTPSFNQSGNLTGHLQVIPSLIQQGATTTVYWNVSNVQSCSVKGTNADGPWSGLSGAQPSSKIYHQVTYRLSCTGYGSQNVNESAVVNVAPVFEEQ